MEKQSEVYSESIMNLVRNKIHHSCLYIKTEYADLEDSVYKIRVFAFW